MNHAPLIQKLALGTVQLGLPYGINNATGKPDENEAFRILDLAAASNISLLDSADAYGDSLKMIGGYLAKYPNSEFKIISKFIDDGQPLKAKIENTCKRLGKSSLYAMLYHRFDDYKSDKHKEELKKLKKEKWIEKIGVSLYDGNELEQVIDDHDISIIQVPLNPFDLTQEKSRLLKEAKLNGKEIHVRSVFLQGLFFKSPSDLSGNLLGFKESLIEFHELLKKYNYSVREVCLNFALSKEFVDQVIIGVETRNQLMENLDAVKQNSISISFWNDLAQLPAPEKYLLNPSHWKTS